MGKRHREKHRKNTLEPQPQPSVKAAARKDEKAAKKHRVSVSKTARRDARAAQHERVKKRRHERNVKAAENFKKVVSWTGNEIDKIVSLPGEAIRGATKATENLKWPLVAAAGLGGVYLLTRK